MLLYTTDGTIKGKMTTSDPDLSEYYSIIIDEAQQISKDNLRTLITRIGTGAKMIFLGDVKQKSVNKREKSALEILMEHFTQIEEIGIVQLGREDIVRHPIIKKLEDIFEKIESSEKLKGNK
jgi:phosphate starvation-inducible PhoH-like protein